MLTMWILQFPLAIQFLCESIFCTCSIMVGTDDAPVVGIYIEQICLAVLFFLKISDSVVFIVEGVLMIVLMALMLSAQILYSRSFSRKY